MQRKKLQAHNPAILSHGSVSVIAVRRADDGEGAIVTPDGNTTQEEGDTAVVIGDRASITEILPLFTEKTEEKKE